MRSVVLFSFEAIGFELKLDETLCILPPHDESPSLTDSDYSEVAFVSSVFLLMAKVLLPVNNGTDFFLSYFFFISSSRFIASDWVRLH